jgi:hypothetical protein
MNAREHYIDHEIRIRLLEKTVVDIHRMLVWILGTTITRGATGLLHSFGFI